MALFFIIFTFSIGALTCAGLIAYLKFSVKLEFSLKSLLFHILIFFGVFILLSGLTAIRTSPRMIYIIIAFLFALAGGANIWLLLRNRIVKIGKSYFLEYYITGFILFLGGLVFLGLSNLFADKVAYIEDNPYFTSISFIALGLFIFRSIYYWKEVPKKIPKAWKYTDIVKQPPDPAIGDDKISCAFLVKSIEYSIAIPPKYRVENAFYLLINESHVQGKGIEYRTFDDKGNEDFLPWYFILTKKEGQKLVYVDPHDTFEGNHIHIGDIIEGVNKPK